MIEDYRECAGICARTDYANKKSVRQHNRAADKMNKLFRAAVVKGPDGVSSLVPLLDEPECAKWLAIQFLGEPILEPNVKEKCLRIVEAIASGDDIDALGARHWLKDWKAKQE